MFYAVINFAISYWSCVIPICSNPSIAILIKNKSLLFPLFKSSKYSALPNLNQIPKAIRKKNASVFFSFPVQVNILYAQKPVFEITTQDKSYTVKQQYFLF